MEVDLPKTKPNQPVLVVVSIILILTLFASAVPQFAASAVTCKFKHKVEQGETLIYIGDLYNTDWLKIADANNMTPPYTVTAGQVLCIPEGEKPSTTTTTTTTTNDNAPAIQVVAGQNELLVSVENFAKKTSYYVRISPASDRVIYRLGQFTTNKDGDFTDWFRVPYYVKRTPQMTLCLKNVWTDKVSCVKYDDIFVYYPFIRPNCGPKEPR